MQDQFHKGWANIRDFLNAAITDRGVKDAVIECSTLSDPQDMRLTMSSGGQTEVQTFSREEIEDSGEAIDAPVAMKVRMLVSHFVR